MIHGSKSSYRNVSRASCLLRYDITVPFLFLVSDSVAIGSSFNLRHLGQGKRKTVRRPLHLCELYAVQREGSKKRHIHNLMPNFFASLISRI